MRRIVHPDDRAGNANDPLWLRALELAVNLTFAVLDAPGRFFGMAFFAMPADDHVYRDN